MNKTLVNSMYRRRMSSSEVVQQLWDAVKVIRYHRQVPNVDRIVKFMSKIYSVNEEEVTRQLGHCVRDGLLLVIKRKGSKGAKVGVEQEGYKLPEGVAERDKHDWYCSQCHLNGDVIPCGDCHRVYHVYCISNPQSSTKNKYQCLTCLGIEEDTDLQDIKQNVLNKLLVMVCTLLRDKYGALLRSSSSLSRPVNIGVPGAILDISTDGEAWRIPYFIHKSSDIAKMASNAKQSVYTNLSQFEADCQTIVHNIVIFHGLHSDLADLARQMARDCSNELKQIRWCHTCYLATGGGKNVRRRKFYKPCHPPHELVFAKESKSSPYWPAKVIHEEDDKLDIRFFGGTHFRTRVDRSNTVPITTNVTALQDFKRTGSWNRAYDELTKHQNFVKKVEEGTYQSSSSSSDSDDSIKSEKSLKSLKSEKSSRSSHPVTPVPQMSLASTAKPKKSRGRPRLSGPSAVKKTTTPRRRKSSTSDEDNNTSDDDDSDVSFMEVSASSSPSLYF
uniref:SAMD1-like winged helix (WH) domain-containing protein n=1 Tax=Lygus hesperus TaxID=30085 RepID=A0A0K8T066_LYGHE